ncbi:HDIG domain-containing metalloprotein [Bacillus mexicanus]|uniref:HDIG domain-containing metalloprotein n=1 Tax=Bacillus mexicanus TaxID=2834415 RepID=UPI003D193EBC
MNKEEFVKRLKMKNAKGYLVGGYVRDKIISELEQKDFQYKDRDYAVSGLTVLEFEVLFPEAKKIGAESLIHKNGEIVKEKTPVYLLEIDQEVSEVALVRNEIKSGNGHNGFSFVYEKQTTIIDDLKRRDFTMNAMAIDLDTSELIDPYGGKEDIQNKLIRGIFIEEKIEGLQENEIKVVNGEYCIEMDGKTYSCKLPQDPLRGIRAGRFASKLGFTIEHNTLKCLAKLRKEIDYLPISRVYEETKKAAIGKRPDLFLQTMKECGLLEKILPEVGRLNEFEHSPGKHPEGNVFEHTKQVTLAASILTKKMHPNYSKGLENNVVSAIFHDVGKAVTQTFDQDLNRYRYIGHEKEGIPIVKEFLKRWNINHWKDHMETITEHHMMMHLNFRKVKPAKLLYKFLGGIKKKQFQQEEIKLYEECFVTLQGIKDNMNDLDSYVSLLLSKKYVVTRLFKNLPLRFKEEVRKKTIDKKEWNLIKNLSSDEKINYLKEKAIRSGMFNTYYYYSKDAGINDKMDLSSFLIVCAADSMGRLKNKESVVQVFEELANIYILNAVENKNKIEKMVCSLKEKYDLLDTYVEDVELLLDNDRLIREFFNNRENIQATVSKKELFNQGLQADDVEYHYQENIRKQEIQIFKTILKLS